MSAAEPSGEQDQGGVRIDQCMDAGAPTQTGARFDPRDPYTLLCERCGYVIEELDREGVCPECGKPIVESLPGARAGTVWQRKPTTKNLMKTWWSTLRHPKNTFISMTFVDDKWFGPLSHTLFLSTGIAWLAVCIESFPNLLSWLLGPFSLAMAALILASCLFLVSGIISIGVQWFSRIHIGRVSPTIAWTIVGHGAVGWVITILIWLVTWKTDWLYQFMHPTKSDYELRQQIAYRLEHILIPGFNAGFLVGFSVLLSIVILGYRRCKFANTARPTEPADG